MGKGSGEGGGFGSATRPPVSLAPILQRETEIGFDVSGGGPVGASLARHHPKAELEREFRRLTGDDVWPAR